MATVDPYAFSNAFARQVEMGERRNALAANQRQQAVENQRADNALAMQREQFDTNKRAQAEEQKRAALGRVGTLAQQALAIADPAQRKGFLEQAIGAYGGDFAAIGANVQQGLPQMLAMPDADLQQQLQQVAQFAPQEKPVEVSAGASLARRTREDGYESVFTAPSAPAKRTVEYRDAGDRLEPVYSDTGEGVPNLQPIKKGASPATVNANSNLNFGRADKLRDEYNAASKNFVAIGDAFTNLQGAARDPTAAGDLSLIFQYMKMLDPGSVVREQEFANAQNAAGVPDRIRNAYNKLLKGERLNPAQRADFVGQAEKLYTGQRARHEKNVKSRYVGLANRYSLNPDDVVGDLDVLAPQPAAAPGGAPRAGAPVRVSTPAEAMRLPPGTIFETPDGRQKVR